MFLFRLLKSWLLLPLALANLYDLLAERLPPSLPKNSRPPMLAETLISPSDEELASYEDLLHDLTLTNPGEDPMSLSSRAWQIVSDRRH